MNRSPNPPEDASGVVTPHGATRRQRLAAGLMALLLRCLAWTLRWRVVTGAGPLETVRSETVIFGIWHNRLALSLMLYNRFVRSHDTARRMAAMVSASRDGALMARVLELFGVQPVRGSTSRRGPQALLELTRWAERGFDLAITPDGPRGPRYQVQDGILAIAQLTGLPIIPVTYRLNWKIQLKSWDRFQIPLPFARCEVSFGPPLRAPRQATEAERKILRERLEQAFLAITRD